MENPLCAASRSALFYSLIALFKLPLDMHMSIQSLLDNRDKFK